MDATDLPLRTRFFNSVLMLLPRRSRIAIYFHVAAQVIRLCRKYGIQSARSQDIPASLCCAALVGYFIGILLIPRFASQQRMFRICTVGGLILSVCVLVIPGEVQMYGHATSLSIWCLSLMGVCNALIYAGIWPLAIHDLGRWTNLGSSFMVMALCSNAFMPVSIVTDSRYRIK